MPVGTGIAVTPTCAPNVAGALIQQQSVRAARGDHHLQRLGAPMQSTESDCLPCVYASQ